MQEDQFQRLLPTFIQVIELTEREETEYWAVMSAVFEGKQVASVIPDSSCYDTPGSKSLTSVDGINNKVRLNDKAVWTIIFLHEFVSRMAC